MTVPDTHDSGLDTGSRRNDTTAPEVGNVTPDDCNVIYGVEDVPPWYLCILLGFQVRIKLIIQNMLKDFFKNLRNYRTLVDLCLTYILL
jgi:hypothetical protein